MKSERFLIDTFFCPHFLDMNILKEIIYYCLRLFFIMFNLKSNKKDVIKFSINSN